MKNTLLALLLSTAVASSLFAQTSTVSSVFAPESKLDRTKLPKTLYYVEDYSSNPNHNSDYEHAKVKVSVNGGKYHFQNKTKTEYSTWSGYNIDPTQNYFFEMEFAVENGPVDFGSGLLFNHTTTKKENYYEFLISPNQYFMICKYTDGVYADICPWQTTSLVHPTGNNKLSVWAKGMTMYFYVNDVLVYQIKRPKYMGNEIGYTTAHESTIGVDKFSIRYNPMPVDELEDTRTDYETVGIDMHSAPKVSDCFPVLNADGTLMFFTRGKNMGSIGIDSRVMMYSELDKATGQWSEPKPLPANINQGGVPQLVYVSPDKNTIIINAAYDNTGKYVIDEGLSMSHRTATGWSNPENMIIEGWENSDHYESYTLSSNNRVLLMDLHMHDTYGMRDIYVSFKQPNGNWTKPKNLGANVNSFGDDGSPCLAPDNVTLYYTSDGKPGYGFTDLFVTRRLDDTWLNWSEPKNLGPHINSKRGDGGLQVDAHGDYAYIDGYNEKTGKSEIQKFLIPEAARPNPVVIVSGKVYNMLTKEPMAMPVIYENLATGEEEGSTTSAKQDGAFAIVLPYGVNYGLTAKQKGYMCESKSVNLQDDSLKKDYAEVHVDLYVMPLTVGQTVTLNNIFFAPDKYELEEKSFTELDRLKDVMTENPSLTIEIDGHTDKGGENATQEQLQTLSQNRANSVRDYLTGKGIQSTRITAIGFGNTKPVSTSQRLNRRVEIKILSYQQD